MRLMLNGLTADEMLHHFNETEEDAGLALVEAGDLAVGSNKQRVEPYQAAALYCLARRYNRPGAQFLEIGTYYGFTTAMMALAAPQAQITTLGPLEWEHQAACANLSSFPGVECVCSTSLDYLEGYTGPELDLIFVDGDHDLIEQDLGWWKWLADGGLILFHDYTPEGAPRSFPLVHKTLNNFAKQIGRRPEIEIIDNRLIGMVGWYRLGPGSKAGRSKEACDALRDRS